MNGSERGSEVVQFAIAVPLLLLVVFSVFQVAGMMLSTSQVSSEITRACRQLDIAGLRQAVSKESFVKAEILGATTQLIPDNLQVENVFAQDAHEQKEGGSLGEGTIEQRTLSTTLSYDVRYEIPSILAMPGLSGRTLARHVTCAYVGSRVIEVSMGAPS